MIFLLSTMWCQHSYRFGRTGGEKIQNYPKINHRKKYRPLLLKGVLGISLLLFWSEPSFGAKTAHFIVSDYITLTGQEEMKLGARLEGEAIPFFTRPISGERIRFMLGDKLLGIALTGGNGLARIRVQTLPKGLHTIQVELGESSFRALPAEFSVGSWDPKQPILIVKISTLMMAQGPLSPLPFLSGGSIPPAHPHAAHLLNRLNKNFSLLYVARNTILPYEKQKKWLETFAFPTAPLIRFLEKEKAFIQQIDHWEEKGWKGLKWIITDGEKEAKKLLEKGLKPVLLIPKKEKDEEKTKGKKPQPLKTHDWEGIEELIKKNSSKNIFPHNQ